MTAAPARLVREEGVAALPRWSRRHNKLRPGQRCRQLLHGVVRTPRSTLHGAAAHHQRAHARAGVCGVHLAARGAQHFATLLEAEAACNGAATVPQAQDDDPRPLPSRTSAGLEPPPGNESRRAASKQHCPGSCRPCSALELHSGWHWAQ